jgi:outer membrane protein assembly factor BamB
MWNAPLQMGGVVGGNAFAIQGDTYFEGSAYNNRYTNPIIIDGNLYYTEPISFAGVTSGPTVCVDLRTGQQIWSSNIPALSFGYIYDVQDPNQHGVYPPMLVSSTGGGLFSVGPATWRFYDAYTGDSLFNVTNVPQGTSALGVNGEYLLLMLTNYGTSSKPNYYLQEWNSSRLWDGLYSGASTSPSVVPPILDGSNPSLLDFNISIPSLSTASSILDAFTNNMVICMSGSYPGGPSLFGPGSSAPYTYFAVNLNATKGTVGSLLWSQPYNAPAGNITVEWGGADPTANSGQGVFVEQYKETSQFVGYSMATGKLLWGPTSGQAALDYYNFGYNAGGNEEGTALAYGKLYSGGYSGIVYCYDLTSGNLLWTYGNGGEGNSTSSGTPYPGNYPTSIYAIGSGIVYTTTTAHTVETPLYQGALTRAINATTGAEVFTLSAFTGESGPPGTGAIADGFATFFNGYDNSVYVVGKGPSATIVQAPQTAITAGENVVIQGTVMDTSAGTHQSAPAADFPNGVPVCSDASMAQWMGYVYQQQQAPTNFTGVTVTLTAIDPNNNYITLGTATTDATGHFIYSWQAPQVSGKYTITATFTGTNGYWGSSEETGMTVQNAPTTQAPTSTPTSDLATMSALTIGIAAAVIVIIIAIAIVGLLLLRKKP